MKRWEIFHTPGTTPGTHKSYVSGPMTGDWSGEGTEVVPAAAYEEALAALRTCATAIDVAIQEREFLGKEPWVYDRYALKQARAVLEAAENA